MKKFSAENKIIMLVLMMILTAGCGLKANPAPAAAEIRQALEEQKLFASLADKTVILTWPSPVGDVSHVWVEKSDLGATGGACLDCPRVYQGIADLTIKSERRFVDSSVESGKSYSYRISLCAGTGTCRSSQTVQIDVK